MVTASTSSTTPLDNPTTLQGYFDDSGGSSGKRPFVLAGFISSAEQWAKFSVDWRAKLDEEPRLSYFKMSEAIALRGRFAIGWTPALRDQRVFELAEIIRTYAEVSVQSAIWGADFDDLIKGIHPAVDKPFYLCLYQLIFSVNTYQLQHHVECKIIFDSQNEISPKAFQEWGQAQKHAPSPERAKLMDAIPQFLDDKEHLPLQAADMYAWLVRAKYEHGEDKIVCKAAMKTLSEIPTISRAWSRSELIYYGARMLIHLSRDQGHIP
jgi:hypothetical protein